MNKITAYLHSESQRSLASLWIGPSLSFLEVLCLESMLRNNHRVVLYTYQQVANVPEGVEVRDAREILDTDCIYIHERTKTPAIHADIFRLNLLRKTNHIWVDCDLFLLRPIDLQLEYNFAYEKESSIGNSVLALPMHSNALNLMLDRIENILKAPETQATNGPKNAFGTLYPAKEVSLFISEFGPKTVTSVLKKTGEIKYALSTESYYPIFIKDVRLFVRRPAKVLSRLSDETIGVHLWSWRLDKIICRQDPGRLAKSWLGRQCENYFIDIRSFPLFEASEALHAETLPL